MCVFKFKHKLNPVYAIALHDEALITKMKHELDRASCSLSCQLEEPWPTCSGSTLDIVLLLHHWANPPAPC